MATCQYDVDAGGDGAKCWDTPSPHQPTDPPPMGDIQQEVEGPAAGPEVEDLLFWRRIIKWTYYYVQGWAIVVLFAVGMVGNAMSAVLFCLQVCLSV